MRARDRRQGAIVWEILHTVLSTLAAAGPPAPGEYQTWETLAANLKRIEAHHLYHLPIQLAPVMQEFGDKDTALLSAIRDRTLEKISNETTILVLSFRHHTEVKEHQFHSSEVVHMALFDQRGQHVIYQYNAAGDINLGAVQSQVEVIRALEKLQAEFTKALQAGVFDEEVATDAGYQLTKAVQQARKPKSDKKTLIEHLSGAKTLRIGKTNALFKPRAEAGAARDGGGVPLAASQQEDARRKARDSLPVVYCLCLSFETLFSDQVLQSLIQTLRLVGFEPLCPCHDIMSSYSIEPYDPRKSRTIGRNPSKKNAQGTRSTHVQGGQKQRSDFYLIRS